MEIHSKFSHAELINFLMPDDLDEFANYLRMREVLDARDVAKEISAKNNNIIIIHEMSVVNEKRGLGHGSELLRQITSAQGNKCIVLVADTTTRQRPGFSLVEFYKKHGFQYVEESKFGPVLVKYK